MNGSIDSPEYWNSRYQSGQANWDMGTPTPVFVDLLESKRLNPGKTLVLGSGKGWDAVLFARHGFDVTAIDFSAEAVACARGLAGQSGVALSLVEDDLFDYSLDVSDEFDYIIEYVTYCAIDPSRRAEFASVVATMLKQGGAFVGLFFPIDDRTGGPPFSVAMDEVQRLFGKKLDLVSIETPLRSVSPRKGKELLTVWRKR